MSRIFLAVGAVLWAVVARADEEFVNQDILAPWNYLLYHDDILAPWNDIIYKDDPLAPWNSPLADEQDYEDYLESNDLTDPDPYSIYAPGVR